jgi:hypothetical protein
VTVDVNFLRKSDKPRKIRSLADLQNREKVGVRNFPGRGERTPIKRILQSCSRDFSEIQDRDSGITPDDEIDWEESASAEHSKTQLGGDISRPVSSGHFPCRHFVKDEIPYSSEALTKTVYTVISSIQSVQNGIKALNFTGESSVKTKCHREESIFS